MKLENERIVELKDGRKGKVIGQMRNGEYILMSGKGGKVTYFTEEEILKVEKTLA